MSKAKFALGAVIGAVAGIVAGLLTAPQSGKQTRADLKHKADELKSNAKQHTDEAVASVQGAVDDVKHRIDRN